MGLRSVLSGGDSFEVLGRLTRVIDSCPPVPLAISSTVAETRWLQQILDLVPVTRSSLCRPDPAADGGLKTKRVVPMVRRWGGTRDRAGWVASATCG